MNEDNVREKAESKETNSALKSKKKIIIIASIVIVIAVVFFSYVQPKVIKPMQEYNNAVELLQSGNFYEAKEIFQKLGNYKDSVQQVENCEIAKGDRELSKKQYDTALTIYTKYKDNPNVTKEKITQCKEGIYQLGIQMYENDNFTSAKNQFEKISDYADSSAYIDKCDKAIAEAKEKAEKEAKEKAKKEAAEEKKEMQKLIGTWYAKKAINYRDEDMTDQLDDISTYYFTFNDDGTGICSMGKHIGQQNFTWKIQKGSNGAIGVWTLDGDSDTIFYYDDHILMYTDEMDSIMYDMHFFCYR